MTKTKLIARANVVSQMAAEAAWKAKQAKRAYEAAQQDAEDLAAYAKDLEKRAIEEK